MKNLIQRIGAGIAGLVLLGTITLSSCQTLPEDAVFLYTAAQGNPKEREGYGILLKEIGSPEGVLSIYKALVPVIDYANSEDAINNTNAQVLRDENGGLLYEEATRYVLFGEDKIVNLVKYQDGSVIIEETPITIEINKAGEITKRTYGKTQIPDIPEQYQDQTLVDKILYGSLSKPRKAI